MFNPDSGEFMINAIGLESTDLDNSENPVESQFDLNTLKNHLNDLVEQAKAEDPDGTNRALQNEIIEVSNRVKTLDRARMLAVGGEITHKYLADYPEKDVPLYELVENGSLNVSEETMKGIGFSRDKSGRFRFKDPDQPELMGSFVDEEVTKAFLLGMQSAETADDQWAVIEDVYDYLGIDAPERPQEKDGVPFMTQLRKKIYSTAAGGMLVALLSLVDCSSNIEQPNYEYSLTAEDTMGIGSVAKKLLIEAGVANPTDAQIFEVIKSLATENGVAVPELGISEGRDDEHLPIGFRVFTKSGVTTAQGIAAQGQ